MTPIVATYLRARRLPQRLAALAVTGLLGAVIAQVPVPTVRVDLEAASYPAVLAGALVPVLIGVLAAAPAPVRLRWLTAVATGQVLLLRAVELTMVIAAAGLAAALCGVTAGLGAAAVQNALVTLCVAVVLTVAIGAGAATAVAGAGTVVMLLTSPGLAGAAWVVVDMQPDAADWLVLGVLAGIATVVRLRPDSVPGRMNRYLNLRRRVRRGVSDTIK